jgi:ankyrin repeat protein
MTRISVISVWVIVLIGVMSMEAVAGPNDDLLAAAKSGERSGVEAAIAQGASVNAVDEKGLSPVGLNGMTPLGLAAAYGHRNVAEFLLDRGANLDTKDFLGHAPLHMAAEYGSDGVAKLLLDRGADIDARDVVGATPLMWAALNGHKSVAALLIARGALVNTQAFSGKTPLHLAATAGQKEVAALLIAHGADIKVRNSDGQTPLQEMQASSLDAATKANIAAALRPPIRAPAQSKAPTAMTPPTGGAQAPSGSLPACTDVAGIARVIMQANPGPMRPAVLTKAIEQVQIAMGCRQAPQVTKCMWVGEVWTCKTP